MTLYDELGVRPAASATEIRDAYRRLARRHHPDQGGRDAATMARINEAHRVLGDPARRAAYDASLRTPITVPTVMPSADVATRVPEVLPPARYPWKLVIVMFLLGVAVVLVGAVLYEPASDPPPDNLLDAGSCVVIEANGDAREVTCGDGESLVVQALVPIDDECPTGTAGYRDRQGRGLACVTPAP